ncbi:MAG: PIN domain-containing protein [Chloroflexi bacterium]|nr:PIN domain-containing protein [Chloroflexota bacterium]
MQLNPLRDKLVAFDTAPLIYYMEEKEPFVGIVAPFFNGIGSGHFQTLTSILTLEEVLVVPFRVGRRDLVESYRNIILDSEGLTVWPVNQQIAEEAALIRATHPRIRTPDALQMATAVVAGAQHFLTNDRALPNLPGLQLLVVDDLVPS